MAAAQRINQEVTLVGSKNKSLQYPCKGVLVDGEMSNFGTWIWATFRVNGEGCKVVVNQPKVLTD